MKKTIDIKFSELCDEIDYWKEQAQHYKKMYEQELQDNIEQTNKSFKQTQKSIGQALMFAMSIKDNEDGSLSISKEDREVLVEMYKEEK